MDKDEIRELLPAGSYERIAEKTGKSSGTISQFFIGLARVSEDTAGMIIHEALNILEEYGDRCKKAVKKGRRKVAA